jgi:hypothetical protein
MRKITVQSKSNSFALHNFKLLKTRPFELVIR